MKVMYVSKAFDGNIGATMHYKAIKEIFGEDNVVTIDLRPIKGFRQDRYIAYGKYRNAADRILRWIQGNMMFISNSIILDIIKMTKDEKVEAVFIEDSVFGNLVKLIHIKCPNIKVFSFYHDIKAHLYLQWLKTAKIRDKIEYRIGIYQEKINQKYADVNIVFNERDAELFQSYYGERPDAIIALPAPIPVISPTERSRVTEADVVKKILFVGKKYGPNIDGLNWFVRNVAPLLTPNIQIDVVGRGLESLKGAYDDPRICIVGGVDSLTPYYENADIVIAPLFDGGGMKSKTVEALSYGKVFIGTEESLFGFWEEMDDSIKGNSVFQCNTVEEWVSTLNNLIGCEIKKYNQEEYELFIRKFSYESAREQLRKIMMEEK